MLKLIGSKDIDSYKIGEGINREIVFPKEVTYSFAIGKCTTDILILIDKIVCKGLSIRFYHNNNEIAYTHLNHLAVNSKINWWADMFEEDGNKWDNECIELISE